MHAILARLDDRGPFFSFRFHPNLTVMLKVSERKVVTPHSIFNNQIIISAFFLSKRVIIVDMNTVSWNILTSNTSLQNEMSFLSNVPLRFRAFICRM